MAESFFATLEHELLADVDFPSRREAHHAIFDYIEVWYNRERRHSSLGYISPVSTKGDSVRPREQRKPPVRQSGSSPICISLGGRSKHHFMA